MNNVTKDVALQMGFYNEEEFEELFGFDYQDAWDRLHSFPSATKIFLSSQVQEEIGITIGKNITDEYPWKEINKEALQKHLGSGSEEEMRVAGVLQKLDSGSSILMEYLPDQSEQNEAFLVYTDISEIHEASDIIRKLELLARLKQKMFTEKRSKHKWKTECADLEIDRWKRPPQEMNVETEAQTVYPIKRTSQSMTTRNVSDVRDGYVELVPFKWKTVNMLRRITDRGTQVRPAGCSRYQQTEPSFPSNAATQYQLDVEDSKIDASLICSTWLQSSFESLSKEAQFNLIEFYRNEYGSISNKPVPAYQTPKINEVLSFMNRALCIGRSVCSMDWHPDLSGICVASYTFETLSKQASKLQSPEGQPFGDALNRMTFEKCAVLLWTFDETLEPLLELKTIREVTSVSFCPYDGELLVGGLSNGQIVLWDLKGEIERVEQAKKAAHEINEYRKQIRLLMDYPAEESIDRTVNPAAVSSLEHSPRSAITCIKWLPRSCYCTTTGHLKSHVDKNHRFMMTASLDGSICFWDLDFTSPALQKLLATAKGAQMVDKTLYQRVNNLFFPTFKLISEIPILSVVIDEAHYISMPQDRPIDFTQRVKHQLQPVAVSCEMQIMLGSFMGQLIEAAWEGYDFEQGTLVNDEQVQILHVLSPIHDGPVLALERNQTVQNVFLSIGGHVFVVSSKSATIMPVFWRKKSAKVTACRWSLDRVPVFFIGMSNGDFEIWDINLKTFRASICMNLGAEALTTISQHRLVSARHCLAVADHNANIRVFSIAPAFVEPQPDEERTFRDILEHELCRKSNQSAWTKEYFERNIAKIEAQIQAEIDAKEMEQQKEADRAKEAAETGKASTSKKVPEDKHLPLSERLEQKYQAKHFQTLLRKLMQRRNVSPERMARQMRPEVERRKYNAEKRDAIAKNIALMESDFLSLQKILRPADKTVPASDDKSRNATIDKYQSNVTNYQQVESEAHELLRSHYLPEMDSFTEVLVKSKEVRDRLCIKVGTNLHHMMSYENKRSLRRKGAAPRTLLVDLVPIMEADEDAEEELVGNEQQSLAGDAKEP